MSLSFPFFYLNNTYRFTLIDKALVITILGLSMAVFVRLHKKAY